MNRLESTAPEIAQALRSSTPDTQREVSILACRFAVKQATIEAPVALACLATLDARQALASADKQQLVTLREELDNLYFDLQDQDDPRHLQVFSQARAVAAIEAASATDPFAAASEAVYEAANATDNPAELYAAIRQRLGQSS